MEKSKKCYFAAVVTIILAAVTVGTYISMKYDKTLFAVLASVTLIGTLALLLLGLKFRFDELKDDDDEE